MLRQYTLVDNGQNTRTAETQDAVIMKPQDHGDERLKEHNDVMYRRLKNRERQRRYRARKRLEADNVKSSSTRQTTPLEEERQQNGTYSISNSTARIQCKRDWKKDARAYASKQRNMSSNPTVALKQGIQAPSLASGLKVEPQLDNQFASGSPCDVSSGDRNRVRTSRRNWKADARNKKN